jgi:hypothetical protein
MGILKIKDGYLATNCTCQAIGKLVVPLSAELTTANIADNQMYKLLVNSLANMVQNIISDPAYDDGDLYEYDRA